MLPSPDPARAHWEKEKTAPLCKGFDVSKGPDREVFPTLDIESRWEMFLRSRYGGAWTGSPLSLMVFPQRQ